MNNIILFDDNSVIKRVEMPRGFAVVCYPICNWALPDYHTMVYELFFGDNVEYNRVVKKVHALAIIKKYNLTMVIDSTDGKVWE